MSSGNYSNYTNLQCCPRVGYYCQDVSSSPFWWGTFIFFMIGVVGCIITSFAFEPKYRGLSIYLVSIAAVCLWIMWGATWLSQWHPLIYPKYQVYNTTNSTFCTNETQLRYW